MTCIIYFSGGPLESVVNNQVFEGSENNVSQSLQRMNVINPLIFLGNKAIDQYKLENCEEY